MLRDIQTSDVFGRVRGVQENKNFYRQAKTFFAPASYIYNEQNVVQYITAVKEAISKRGEEMMVQISDSSEFSSGSSSCSLSSSGSSDSSDSDSSDSGVSTREELRAHQEDIDALGLGFAVIGNWKTAQVSKI